MTYHKDNRIRTYVQGYGFLFFKKLGNKLLSGYNKYGKKIIHRDITAAKIFNESKYGKTLKKEGSKFLKISGKKALEKAAPAVGDYVGSKIADKFISLSRRQEEEPYEEEEQEIIISPRKRQEIINYLRMF